MKKNLICLCVMCFGVLSVGFAQKDAAALEILDAMSAKYKSMPAFEANFSYNIENPEEGIDEGFQGIITVKDSKYKLNMGGQEIINDGENVWTFLKDDNEVTIAEYDEEESEITLSNIFSIYKSGYKYLWLEERNNGTVDVVDLVPEDLEKTFFKIRMEITRKDKDLLSFKVFDKSGNRYLYKINEFKSDSNITDQDFVFDIAAHEGVEVIDFR